MVLDLRRVYYIDISGLQTLLVGNDDDNDYYSKIWIYE